MVRRLPDFPMLLVCLATLAGLPAALRAAEQEFPYPATIIGEDVEVRCGPGKQFYVTSLATQNEQVTVYRHDHGGWYMIAPPHGSFSWVEADLVKRIGEDRGVVTSPESGAPARAIVRMGSSVSNEHAFYSRALTEGDEVTILGEEMLETPQGPARMFKIEPPSQEFRWIKGEYLIPLSAENTDRIAADPYQIPARHRRQRVAEGKSPVVASTSQELSPPLVAEEPPADLSKLKGIDERYAAMMSLEPADWDLAEIAHAYAQLHQECSPRVAQLIDKRLEIVARRQEIASHFRQFVQLTNETSQRDAELFAQQAGHIVAAEDSDTPGLLAPEQFAAVEMSGPQLSIPPSSPASHPSDEGPVAPQLNGAGIVQIVRNVPGAPAFVLLAPDGRLLAFLEPAANVPLKRWVGKPAGLIGHRDFEPTLGADLIRVKKIMPIQLVDAQGQPQ